jgi:hypothetical protein
MFVYPPPHYILFEPLDDIQTRQLWSDYKKDHSDVCEFYEVDAAEKNAVDTFSPWFETWISQVPEKQSTRYRILIIFHAEFLTYACQQMLRRSLEQRSYKCRVWFQYRRPCYNSTCVIQPLYCKTNTQRFYIVPKVQSI